MNILITGGAGYIGSTIANYLIDKKCNVTIIDNLTTGDLENIPKKCIFFKCDIADKKKISNILKNDFDIVMHFAAYIKSDESIRKPKKYFSNNYLKSKIFIDLCLKNKIKNYIISSTAAVYKSCNRKVSENSALSPLTPYAKSKLKLENFLFKKNKVNFIILRYFNVGGVEKKMRSGFNLKNKSLISNLINSLLKKKIFFIYGNHYKTKDGTAIRDFIHINDLAIIHYKFAKKILKKKYNQIFNCGYGKGMTVLEIYDAFCKTLNSYPKIIYKKNKKNQIGISISDVSRVKSEINIKFTQKKIDDLAISSIRWFKNKMNKINK